MTALYTGYVLALLSIIPGLVWLAWYAWHRGKSPVFRLLTTLCVLASVNAPAFILMMLDTDHAFMWARLRFIGVAFVPVLFLLFVIAYVGHESWLRPKWVVWLWVMPLITQAVIWFAPGWFFQSWEAMQIEGFGIEIVSYTGWFHIHAAYTSGIFGLTLFIAGQFVRRSAAPYRMQGLLICAAGLMPFLAGLLTTSGILPYTLPPITPLGVGLSLIIAGWALFRYKLLEVMPVAYETIIRNMNDAVIVLDNAQQVVSLNPAAEKLLNQRLENAIGQPIVKIVPAARDMAERYRNRMGETIEFAGPNSTVYDLRMSELHTQTRQPVGWVAVLRDITVRKRAEQDREQMIRDLEAYSRTVAHDLKNPLSIIRGYAEIMMMDRTLSIADCLRFAERIRQSSDKMLEIMDSLLLLAQVRNQTDIPCEPVDMGTVVQTVLDSLKSQIDGTEAVMHVPDSLPAAVGYPPWVELVWINYISNALKYGGKPPVIEIVAEAQDGFVRYLVRDNGAGLTLAQQAVVFEPFMRFHGEAEGHGIGLSIVQRIMEKLGGEAGVESTTGSGSQFYFTLPAV